MDLKITRLSDGLGAEATGVDLSKPVDGETKARLNAAFSENAVLVIREQDLSAPQLLEAVCCLPKCSANTIPGFSLPECPLIHYLSN